MKNTQARKVFSVLLSVAIFAVLLIMILSLFTSPAKNMTEPEFYEMFREGKIKKVYISGIYNVKVLLKEESSVANESSFPNRYDFSFNIANRVTFAEKINEIIEEFEQTISTLPEAQKAAAQAQLEMMRRVEFDNPNAVTFWDVAYPVIIIALFIFLAWFVISRMAQQNNQNINFGKSKARVNENVKVRFTDVAGAEEEKEELQEIIDFLKNPQKFSELGARIPHGVLLVGPPGTGKTLFAKAVAGEAGVPFFSISGSDFVEMFVGVGASRVRDLFEQAKKNLPCIVFIDEIDAVGRQRGAGLGGGHDEREQTLNQLLVEMDGFETNSGIIIMAATNRSDILDPALMRPGRFDRQIYVHCPDVRGREAILKVHARNKPLEPEVDFQIVARITAGFTGADLENLLNEAAILAVRGDRKRISMGDINEGITKVLMGPQKKSRLVTEYDKRITAYHEAGHAVLACRLKHCDPVHEVTIIPRGQAAGYTMTRPDNDDNHMSKAQLMDQITMGLGGRVAEELVTQNICTGASGDIRSITATAHSMVTEWGMSDAIGPVYYGSEHEVFIGRSYQAQNSFSESMAALIDAEANKIIKECHERATKMLKDDIQILHNMARVLLEKETIHTDEVDMLMAGKSVEEVVTFIDKKYSTEKAEPKKVPKNDLLKDFPTVEPLESDKK